MPTHDVHTNNFLAITGLIAAGIKVVFDVDAPILFAGFVGTWVGLAVAPQRSYLAGFMTLVLGSMTTGFLTPLLIKWFGDYPTRVLAFSLGFFIVGFRIHVISYVRKDAFNDLRNRIKASVTTLFTGPNQ